MHPVLRLYEDVLSNVETVEFRLPALPRFIFVTHGSEFSQQAQRELSELRGTGVRVAIPHANNRPLKSA